jgi:hypothetical protein
MSALPFQIGLLCLGVVTVIVDASVARRRACRYFHGAGLRVVSMKIRWVRKPSLGEPFDEFRGRYIFCAHLKDLDGASIPAWVSSVGMVSLFPDDPLEVKFAPTGAFPHHPNL